MYIDVSLCYTTIMKDESHLPVPEQSLIYRLRKRAEIRRRIRSERDNIAELLDEAADALEPTDTGYSC